jgi:hypothetical protein
LGSLKMPMPGRAWSSAASLVVLPSENPASLVVLNPAPAADVSVAGFGERPRSGRRCQLPSVSFLDVSLVELGHRKNCTQHVGACVRAWFTVYEGRWKWSTYGIRPRPVLFDSQVVTVLLAPLSYDEYHERYDGGKADQDTDNDTAHGAWG